VIASYCHHRHVITHTHTQSERERERETAGLGAWKCLSVCLSVCCLFSLSVIHAVNIQHGHLHYIYIIIY